jgi:hypothetical protein
MNFSDKNLNFISEKLNLNEDNNSMLFDETEFYSDLDSNSNSNSKVQKLEKNEITLEEFTKNFLAKFIIPIGVL